MRARARARGVRVAPRGQADGAELDRRLGGGDPGVPPNDARRGAQDRWRRRGTGRDLPDQVLRRAGPERRDRPGDPGARRPRPHEPDAARFDGDAGAGGSHLRRTRRGAPDGRQPSHPRRLRARRGLALFVNRRVTLAARPSGFPQESDFALDEAEVPEPGPGEVLIRTLWVSVDPYQRGRMSTARSYARSLELGDVITAQAVGEVVESRDGRFSEGDLAVGQLGWQQYAAARAGAMRAVPAELHPPTLALH